MNQANGFDKQTADFLNQSCFCRTLNLDHLQRLLNSHHPSDPVLKNIFKTHQALFSSFAVFITQDVANQLNQAVEVLDRIIQLPRYQELIRQRSPEVAHQDHGPLGVCMGFDFHLSETGPKLIEINTNAGGQFLNSVLARAQESCCVEMNSAFVANPLLDDIEATLFTMFINEWHRQRLDQELCTIVILDDDPKNQFLAPEFELFKDLFISKGLKAFIADPSELNLEQANLTIQGNRVDLIYNRLTDFYLEDERHSHIRHAYETGSVVMTPNPHNYSIYADKQNLVDLSNPDLLEAIGVSTDDRQLLTGIVPKSQKLESGNVENYWKDRRHYFFKPVSGYGAKATYRGDKLTKSVWDGIKNRAYIAQELVPPAQRLIELEDGRRVSLKFDVRAYAYAGKTQLLAARMYSGQTTNFRTEGGGFAPIVILPK